MTTKTAGSQVSTYMVNHNSKLKFQSVFKVVYDYWVLQSIYNAGFKTVIM